MPPSIPAASILPARSLDAHYQQSLGDIDPARHLLGVVNYATAPHVAAADTHPEQTIVFGAGGEQFAEVWSTDEPVRYDSYGAIDYACSAQFLFCAGRIEEADHYADAVRQTYFDLFTLLDKLGFPRLVRVWNYIAHINEPNGAGQEIYRDFCVGRSHALEQLDMLFGMPATTVIGSSGGGIAFYLIATRDVEPVNIENPRQVSAYHYPPRYGTRAPNFARATYLPGPAGERGTVFVSGTASIIGHETVHEGDVRAQCRTALENVALLIGRDNLAGYGIEHDYRLADLRRVKVYVRRPEDIPTVRSIYRSLLPPTASVVYLRADVCRSNLLVELEAVAG